MNINSYVGRWITFGGAAVAALATTFIANEAQILFNLQLDQSALLGFLTPFTIGTFALAWKWLHNRGVQELSVLERDLKLNPVVVAEIKKLIEANLPPAPAPSTEAVGKTRTHK